MYEVFLAEPALAAEPRLAALGSLGLIGRVNGQMKGDIAGLSRRQALTVMVGAALVGCGKADEDSPVIVVDGWVLRQDDLSKVLRCADRSNALERESV